MSKKSHKVIAYFGLSKVEMHYENIIVDNIIM